MRLTWTALLTGIWLVGLAGCANYATLQDPETMPAKKLQLTKVRPLVPARNYGGHQVDGRLTEGSAGPAMHRARVLPGPASRRGRTWTPRRLAGTRFPASS